MTYRNYENEGYEGRQRGLEGSRGRERSERRGWNEDSEREFDESQRRYGRGESSGEFRGERSQGGESSGSRNWSEREESQGFGRSGRSSGTYGNSGQPGDEFMGREGSGRGWQQSGTSSRGGSWKSGSEQYGGGGFGSRGRSSRGEFTGKGPRGYSRSDDRIKEDVCDRLADDGEIDASQIEVDVVNGEVILKGNVVDRECKWNVESLCEGVSGVKDVQNQLRLTPRSESGSGFSSSSGRSSSGSSSTGRSSSGSSRSSGNSGNSGNSGSTSTSSLGTSIP